MNHLINNILYRLQHAQLTKKDPDEQIRQGREMYSMVYNDLYKNKTGDRHGGCIVEFDCSYSTHVTYHLVEPLKAAVTDENSVVSDYQLENDGEHYKLRLDVATSEEPMPCADATTMFHVLAIPTVSGDFERTVYEND